MLYKKKHGISPWQTWILLLGLVASAPGSALLSAPRPFSASEELVLQAYLAYYGRPGDVAGLRYWSTRLDQEGGSLDSIIQAFGVSAEYTERYGDLSDEALVSGLYQQLLGRDPDPEGLAFYVELLDTDAATLQTIALDVIFGVINEDVATVEHRMSVARYYITRIETLGEPPPDVSADALNALIRPVTADAATLNPALVSVDILVADLPHYRRVLRVSKAEDTADGACDADCSLREAIMAANASPGQELVEVPAGRYRLTLNGDSENSDAYRDLEILDDLHLTGAGIGATIIDGDGWTRVIEVDTFDQGLSARIARLTVTGGFHPFGGALLNRGVLLLEDVEVSENTGFNGGGVLNTDTLRIRRGSLTGNKAFPDESGATGFGGGLWSDVDGYVIIDSSAVSGNNAHYNGGGIYAAGFLEISDSTIASNAAGAVGGGVFVLGDLSLRATFIAENAANDGGGLATQDGASGHLVDCEVMDNSATGVDLGGGGGLFNYAAALVVENCSLTGNVAYGEGGGAIETNGPLTVYDSTISGNRAQWHDASMLPDDTSAGLGGGLLTIAGSVVRVERTRFDTNVAGVSGGAIYNDRDVDLTLVGVEIDDNLAEERYGGGINNEGDIAFFGGSLTGNSAPIHGGGLTTNIGRVELQDLTVSGNTAINGGAFGNYLGGTLILIRTDVRGNTAEGLGGAILNDRDSEVVVDASQLVGNRAGASGGAIFNSRDGRLTLNNVAVEGNVVDGANGGGITNEGTANLSGGSVAGNSSPEQGGGITCNFGDLVIEDVQITGNTSQNGGGLSNGNGCSITMERSAVLGNTAVTGFGGGLLNDVGTTTLVECMVAGNVAVLGGGVSNNHPSGRVELIRSSIQDNSADAGAAFVNFGTLSVDDSLVSGGCDNHGAIEVVRGVAPVCQ